LNQIAQQQALKEKERQQKIAAEQAKKAKLEAEQKKQQAAMKGPWNGKKFNNNQQQKQSIAQIMQEEKLMEGKKKPVTMSQKVAKNPQVMKLPGGNSWNQRIKEAEAAPTRPAPAPMPKVNKTKGGSPWAQVASHPTSRAITKGWDQEPTLGKANAVKVVKPVAPVKKAPKKNNHQQSKQKIEKLFNQQATKVQKEVEIEHAELKKWFYPEIKRLQPKCSAETVFNALISFDDVYEIKNQITVMFGEGEKMKAFGDEFIRRSGKANKNSWQVKTNGGKKGKKKNNFKNANGLLAFTVGASANRTNMGEIQTPQ